MLFERWRCVVRAAVSSCCERPVLCGERSQGGAPCDRNPAIAARNSRLRGLGGPAGPPGPPVGGWFGGRWFSVGSMCKDGQAIPKIVTCGRGCRRHSWWSAGDTGGRRLHRGVGRPAMSARLAVLWMEVGAISG